MKTTGVAFFLCLLAFVQCARATSITISPNDDNWHAASSVVAPEIDAIATHADRFVVDAVPTQPHAAIEGGTYTIAAVAPGTERTVENPEPATLIMFGSGLVAIVSYCRRRPTGDRP